MIANPPNTAQIEDTPYHSPKLHPDSWSSVGMRRGTGRQTYTQTDTQTAVANIHFASSTIHAKCNKAYLLTYPLRRHCWLGGRKGIRPVKMGDGGGGHWWVRMEWRPAGWSACLPPLILPCTTKSRSSLLEGLFWHRLTGWSRKKGRKTVTH